jgi:5-methylcytosine-specific restriction protein A
MWRTKLCKQPGCGKVAEQGKDFCSSHTTSNYITLASAESSKRRRAEIPWASWYGLAVWQRLRAMFLGRDNGDHVICEFCDPQTGERCRKPTTDVDHKLPHRGAWKLFVDVTNLQGLCHYHHSQKTAREDHGFGNG